MKHHQFMLNLAELNPQNSSHRKTHQKRAVRSLSPGIWWGQQGHDLQHHTEREEQRTQAGAREKRSAKNDVDVISCIIKLLVFSMMVVVLPKLQ